MSEELGRKLPVSIESEQAVLGSILIRPDSLEGIIGLLEPEDFSLEEHKRIYEAIKAGNAEAAEREMTEHVRNAMARLLKK